MSPAKFERIGLALYLIGVLTAVLGVLPRVAAERAHETTEIVMDAPSLAEWQTVVPATEQTELPTKVLQAGVRSLAFPEVHLDDMIKDGLLVAQSGPEIAMALRAGAFGLDSLEPLKEQLDEGMSGSYLVFTRAETTRSLQGQMKVLFGDRVKSFLGGQVVYIPEPLPKLRTVGFGFDAAKIAEYQRMGFSVWLRPENRPGLTSEQLDALFAEWGRIPDVQGVIFAGGLNEAIGYPDLLEEAAANLSKLGWKIGYIELPEAAQQDGIETLVRLLPGQVARVLAVSPAHQAKLSPFRVLGMYSLGARERNIRVLYVRPFAVAGRPELDQEFLFSLAQELEKEGPASLFEPEQTAPPNLLLTFILGVSAGALALLLLNSLGLRIKGGWWLVLALAPIGALGATAIGKGVLFRSLLALAVGMGAPLYAFLHWVYPAVAVEPGRAEIKSGLLLLLKVSLFSVTGGLFVAALLSDTTFLLGLDRFKGVKLLTLATPLLILFCFLLKRYSKEQIVAGLCSSVAVYQALLVGFLGVVFALLFLRSGNDAAGTASEGERYLRVVLDRVLGVRPRFKEFMMAHPALVCLPIFAAKTGFLPSLVLVLLAGIGQAGIVDTFAHVHTPLDVTLIRIGLGVLFGAVVGAVVAKFAIWAGMKGQVSSRSQAE